MKQRAPKGLVEAATAVNALAGIVNAMGDDPALQLVAELLRGASQVASCLVRGEDDKAMAYIKLHFDHAAIVPAYQATRIEYDRVPPTEAEAERIARIESLATALVINTAGTAQAKVPKDAVYEASNMIPPCKLGSIDLGRSAITELIRRVTQRAEAGQ